MLTRRETILGGALTLLWGGCTCAKADTRNSSFGCMLEPHQAEPLLASAAEPQSFSDAPEKTDIEHRRSRI